MTTTLETWMPEARQIAAQCWCDDETKNTVMDTVLAEAVAKRIAAWMDTAAQTQPKMKTTEPTDPCKPDKNVLVPPYVYLTEGYDPAECDRLNAAAQKEYEAEKARRAAMQPNESSSATGMSRRGASENTTT